MTIRSAGEARQDNTIQCHNTIVKDVTMSVREAERGNVKRMVVRDSTLKY